MHSTRFLYAWFGRSVAQASLQGDVAAQPRAPMTSDEDERMRKAANFGGRRYTKAPSVKLRYGRRVWGPNTHLGPAPVVHLSPKQPDPSRPNPFTKRPWRGNERRVNRNEARLELDDEDFPSYQDDLFAGEDELAPARHARKKRESQPSQDILWQRQRPAVVDQHYRTAKQQQHVLIDKLEDRIKRWQPAQTCRSCRKGFQNVLYIGLTACVVVTVQFSHCARCAWRFSGVAAVCVSACC